MYRRILVGYDDTDHARDALALGRQLAEATGAHLVAAGVFEFDPVWGGAAPQLCDAEAGFAHSIEAAALAVGAEPRLVPSSSPARGLHELAEQLGADLILVGSANLGRRGRSFAGTTGVALLHGSPCAVGIAPRGYRERGGDAITAVATGFDGSAESREALMTASRIAASAGAKLKLISVAVPPPVGAWAAGPNGREDLLEAVENETRAQLVEARNVVPDGIDVEATLVSGDPVHALASAANVPGTLLVVGSRGYGPLRRVLLGSVASSLVGSAFCPLIVTPRGMQAISEGEEQGPAEAEVVW